MKVMSGYATIVHRREIVLISGGPATRETMTACAEAMRVRDHRWVAPPGSIPEHDYCRTTESGRFVTLERAVRH